MKETTRSAFSLAFDAWNQGQPELTELMKMIEKLNCSLLEGKVPMSTDKKDEVNHPAHYAFSSIEPIAAIDAWELGFALGNTVKYIARAGRKDPAKTLEDLKKARFYLDWEIRKRGG